MEHDGLPACTNIKISRLRGDTEEVCAVDKGRLNGASFLRWILGKESFVLRVLVFEGVINEQQIKQRNTFEGRR